MMELFMYLEYNTVNNLAVILYHSFTRCYCCRKHVKVKVGSLYCFLQLHMNLPLSQNKKFNLKNTEE